MNFCEVVTHSFTRMKNSKLNFLQLHFVLNDDIYCGLASSLQGERNFNRFSGWLGKNSTMGKNYRLLENFHVHVLASRESSSGR